MRIYNFEINIVVLSEFNLGYAGGAGGAWAGGATVARSIPDRKVACSNHVRLKISMVTTFVFWLWLYVFLLSQTSILGKDAKNGQLAKASLNMRRAIVKSCSRKNPEQSVKKC